MTTYYAVTVDTEEEWNWNLGFPAGKPQVSNIREIDQFQSTCEQFGAAVTYFTNLAVLENHETRQKMLSLAGHPLAEIGMHIHPWNTPPITGDRPVTPRESFLANLPKDLIWQKLQCVLDSFRGAGLQPTSFRGGRYSSGPEIHGFLRDNGFVADASVVPFTAWPDDGAPDYRHRNLQPQRLLPTDEFRAPLWEIPLTLSFTRAPIEFWSKIHQYIQSSWLRHLRLIGLADRLNMVRRVWLNFEDPLGKHMIPLLHCLRPMQLPCITFTVHSSSLQVNANGCYTQTEQERDRLFAQVAHALELVSSWPEFKPATISQIAQNLEVNYHACSRN